MSIFAIGDLHLSFNSEKPMDIFSGWGNHAERLEQNWNHIVSGRDTVIIPGDISWAMSLAEAKSDFAFIDQLPGQKIMLKGNHDYWWSTMSKMNAWLRENQFGSIRFLFNNSYLVDGIGICGTRSWFYEKNTSDSDLVYLRELNRLKLSLDSVDKTKAKEVVVFLHYPPIYCEVLMTDIIQILRQYGVRRCYYGHLHGKSVEYAFCENRDGIDFQLVTADYLKFAPYKIH